ncbi:MAG: radical SAM protein [Candidatus Omnitrophota bacterium]
MNIALISLYDMENYASRVLAAFLRRRGHRVVEVYFKHWTNNFMEWPKERELAALEKILKKYSVGLVGVSVRASAYHKVAEHITKRVRSATDAPVVWGGIHATLVPEKCIEAADIVCIGEGEYAMAELAEALSKGGDISPIKNLWVRTKKGVEKNDVRPLIQDLDTLPFRDFTSGDKFYINGRTVAQGDPLVGETMCRIMISRGCVYDCSFCYNSALKKIYSGKGRYYRYRSPGSVILEINEIRGIFKKLKRIMFDDEVFVFDRDWTEEFLERYKREAGLPFECFFGPKDVNDGYIGRLKSAGLDTVYMGVQNTERINRDLYRRPISDAEVTDAVNVLRKLGINARYQLVLDDPVSTSEDKQKLLDLVMSFPRPFELYLFSMTVFPATELAERLVRDKVIEENDVEGPCAAKTFRQYRVDLSYPRRKEDVFWISLIVLASKNFIPRSFIKMLSKNRFLMRHPRPLAVFAQACNLMKMCLVVMGMAARGEISAKLMKQWLNPRSLITQ